MFQQGTSWLLRKAINIANISVTITMKTEKNDAGQPVLHVSSEQVATGGIRNVESHFLDWVFRESADMVAGVLAGRSRFVYGKKDENEKAGLDLEVQSNVKGNAKTNEKIRKFLQGEILADGSPSEGWLVETSIVEGVGECDGVWLQNITESKKDGWTNEQVRCLLAVACHLADETLQVWGFEMIDGQRLFCRRTATIKGKDFALSRVILTFNHE